MKVLVTGASGFIGCHIVRELLAQGYQVRALIRSTSDLRSLENLRVELVQGDLLQPETLEAAVRGSKMIFHVAAVFAYWGHTDEEIKTIATEGTSHILEAAHRHRVKRIILTSSSAVLGSSSVPVPLNENNSHATLNDLPPYVLAKIAQEQRAFDLAKKLRLNLIAVCPTLTVGGLDFRLTESNRMIVSYLKDPFKATWLGGCNVVSVKDIAVGHILAAQKGKPGERYILGSENLEWMEVHKMISGLCGLPGPFITANHTSAYLASTMYEIISLFTHEPPPSTRAQAKMVGQYFWYSHRKMKRLGYFPRSSRQALTEALSWLIASDHVPVTVRSIMNLSEEIYTFRRSVAKVESDHAIGSF